jgi:hypothetical protein
VAQEPEGSKRHSQQPTTDPYPEPVESNPPPTNQSSLGIPSSHLRLGLPNRNALPSLNTLHEFKLRKRNVMPLKPLSFDFVLLNPLKPSRLIIYINIYIYIYVYMCVCVCVCVDILPVLVEPRIETKFVPLSSPQTNCNHIVYKNAKSFSLSGNLQ